MLAQKLGILHLAISLFRKFAGILGLFMSMVFPLEQIKWRGWRFSGAWRRLSETVCFGELTVKWAGYWGTKLSPYNFWQTKLNHFLAKITQATTCKIQIRNWCCRQIEAGVGYSNDRWVGNSFSVLPAHLQFNKMH